MSAYVGVPQLLEISFEAWGVLFCLIAMCSIEYDRRVQKRKVIPLFWLMADNVVVLISDAFAIYYRGVPGANGRAMVYGANYLAFISIYFLNYFAFLYLKDLVERYGTKISDFYEKFFVAVLVVGIIMISLTQFNGLIYYIDYNNLYHRGPLYFLTNVFNGFMMLIWIVLLIKHASVLPKRYFICCIVYVLAPILATVIQQMFYGFSLVQISVTASVMIMFVVHTWNRTDFILEKQEELAKEREQIYEWRLRVLRAQIQPHFIFNCLSTIHYLCDADPKMAAEATQRFSTFLRATIDGFDKKQMVSLTEEMYLVNNYLYLEKLRYGDRIHIEKRMEINDMELPSLTLQTLVENSVKHGIVPKVEGGTIWISSYERDNFNVIEVKDNGIGFNPSWIENDGKNHVGMKNAKERLATICNGRLEFISTVGEGSIARIYIPKN